MIVVPAVMRWGFRGGLAKNVSQRSRRSAGDKLADNMVGDFCSFRFETLERKQGMGGEERRHEEDVASQQEDVQRKNEILSKYNSTHYVCKQCGSFALSTH